MEMFAMFGTVVLVPPSNGLYMVTGPAASAA